MKRYIDNLTRAEKLIVAFLVGWTFIHFVLLLISDGRKESFWPFDEQPILSDDYDITEFIVYVFSPIMIFCTYVYLNKTKTQDFLEKENHFVNKTEEHTTKRTLDPIRKEKLIKYSKHLTIIFWITIVFFGGKFIWFWIKALGYGSPPAALSIPYVFGALLASSIIPFTIWFIRFYIDKKIKNH